MIESLSKFLEAVAKAPTTLILTIFIAVSVLRFSPDSLAQILALNDFRANHRNILGPTWLLLAAVIVSKVIAFLVNQADRHSASLKRQKYLHELTPSERGFLLPFIENEENTIFINISDGIAGGLHRKGIIYRASNFFDVLQGIPYNLQPWARKYLSDNPKLLQGAVREQPTPREFLDW